MGAGVLRGWARRIALAVVLCSEVVVLATSASASATGREGPGARQAGARDRDGDGLPDRWEKRYGLSSHRNSSRGDPDRDSLSNRSEYRLRLNPRRRDTDRDGLSDGREVKTTRTDPRRKDSDGDGVSDGREVALGSDPLDPLSKPKTPGGNRSPDRTVPPSENILPEDSRALAGILRNPIDPAQQTLLSFGDRSHWLQPWRGYLDTVPATRLRDAVGINIDNMVATSEVPALARLLAASGFKRARYEIGWDSIDYDDPSRMRNLSEVRTVLTALRDNGIRPLILLNSHHGIPCPTHFFDARIVQSAARGDRQVRIDSATALAVIPGKTGLNSLTGDFKAADVIFSSISGDVATLSKPLPRDLSPGTYRAATLRYMPFGPPQLSDGTPNPGFEETLAGWLSYVRVVTREARNILGSDNFDVEIWNELGFGSDFLYSDRYYDPPLVFGSGDPTYVIPARTIAALRDPASGVSGVSIGNGFESQRPWASGASSPLGLTAISKHPYQGMRRFPQASLNDAPGVRPLDALGRTDGVSDNAANRWRDSFVPTYDSFFPEYYLNAIQTEHFIRDLSPITSDVYGTPHGRFTAPAGGQPPTMWVTEWNMDPSGADPSNPANLGGPPLARLTDGDIRHMQAKAVLRFLTAWVNKGVSAVHLFAVKSGNLALVDPGFFAALQQGGGAYPGDDLGGETMMAVRRLSASLTGAGPVGQARALFLNEIGDYEGRKQFEGDGTAAHPPLYDRDVVAFFPYQVNDRRFVIPVYVMTRNIAKLYWPDAPANDRTRYDLPEERFRLSISGLKTNARIAVRATDPLSGQSIATRIVSQAAATLVVELPLTDSPRLLTIDELG
jgi:thrombospondin type 3 repeat protein